MGKLVACYIVEGDEDVFELSIKSVAPFVDEVVVINGNGYFDYIYLNEYSMIAERNGFKVTEIHSPYLHQDKGANGKQRNIYLDYVKERYKDESDTWVLVVDADEVMTGLEKLKDFLHFTEHDCFSIRMHHFFYNFGFEDSTLEKHYVPTRLFKLNQNLRYEEAEHPALTNFKNLGLLDGVRNYHLGYAREVFRIKKKYLNHLEKSNIHSEDYLKRWYLSHLVGTYPVKNFPVNELPEVIKKHFGFEYIDEMIYFQRRDKAEAKHFIMAWQWKEYFKPVKAIDCGCGMGHYLFALNSYGVDAYGFDISKYAVENTPYKGLGMKMFQNDLSVPINQSTKFDLVLALDVLEHLSYDKLDVAIENIKKLGDRVLTSIPYITDPNCDLDITHIIKETREWWVNKFIEHGFKVKDVPDYFIYSHQMLELNK